MFPETPFKKRVYMEGADKISGVFGFRYNQDEIIVGDIHNPPISKSRKFGVVVVNEVFTRVRPENREKVLEGLAERIVGLFITDKAQLSEEEATHLGIRINILGIAKGG
jgi:hypothetical protein